MRFLGRLTDWNDAKGFGFVEPNGGGDRAFVHVKAFERLSKRPANGDLISYVLERDARGRCNAGGVRFATTTARVEPTKPSTLPRKSIAMAFGLLLAAGWWLAKIPTFAVGVYAGMSLLAFGMYASDKAAAQNGRWRTKESSLHLVDALGGWPGGLVAQDVFRHKSKKGAFQATFWVTVAINLVGMGWLLHDAP